MMKAKDLYEKFGERLKNPITFKEALGDIAVEFIEETQELIKVRNVKTDSGLLNITKELNQKGNAFANMFNPPVLKRNWYQRLFDRTIAKMNTENEQIQ